MNESDVLTALGGLGVLLGIAGFAGVLIPGLNASFVFVALVGVLAGVQGARYLIRRSGLDYAATDPGDPERRYQVPVPGDEIRGHDGYRSGRGRAGRRRSGSGRRRRGRVPRTLRRRIEAATVETIRLREHCSAAEAERRIEAGTWTDDPIAARYLGADVPLSLSTRVRRLLARSPRQAQAARALDALEALRNESAERAAMGSGGTADRADGDADAEADGANSVAEGRT